MNQQSGFRLAGLTPGAAFRGDLSATAHWPCSGCRGWAGPRGTPAPPGFPPPALCSEEPPEPQCRPQPCQVRVWCSSGELACQRPRGLGVGWGGWIHLLTAAARTAGSVSWNRAGTRRVWLRTRTFLVAPGPLCQGGRVSPAKQHQETGSLQLFGLPCVACWCVACKTCPVFTSASIIVEGASWLENGRSPVGTPGWPYLCTMIPGASSLFPKKKKKNQKPAVKSQPLTPGDLGGLLSSALPEPVPRKLWPFPLISLHPRVGGPLRLGWSLMERSSCVCSTDCGAFLWLFPQLCLLNFFLQFW